jgi:hypothetical protein
VRFRREDLRVDEFEYVEVGADLALLRVAGAWRGVEPHAVALIAERSGMEIELPTLPEPPDDGAGLWRAAFSARADLLDGHSAFVLVADDGRVVELPEPGPHGMAAEEREPEPEPAPEPVEDLLDEPRSYAPPYDADDVDFRAFEAERVRHERVEAELREQLRVVVAETADFMGRLQGYEERRAELEKELSWERLLHKETRRLKDEAERERDDALRRFGPVKADLERARYEVEASARAARQLVEARERIEELERRLERQEDLLRNARDVLDQGAGRLGELEARLLRLRDEAVGLPPGGADDVEHALDEAERGTERLAHLERRIGELREGIASE